MTKEEQLRAMLSQVYQGEDLEKIMKKALSKDIPPAFQEKNQRAKEMFRQMRESGSLGETK